MALRWDCLLNSQHLLTVAVALTLLCYAAKVRRSWISIFCFCLQHRPAALCSCRWICRWAIGRSNWVMPTVHWQWHQKISFLCHFVCRSLMHLHSPCCCLADLTVLAKVYTFWNLAPMLVCCFQHISAGSQIRCSIIYTYDGNGAACQPCIFSIYEVSIYRTRSESSAYTDAHV